MRIIAILLTSLFFELLLAQGNSLKIQTDDTFYYPPNLKFEVSNDQGKVILTQNDLTEGNPIILDGDYMITVFTSWGSGKDQLKVDGEASVALEQKEADVSLKKSQTKSWYEGKPKVIITSFKKNGEQYDAIIAFENNIFFNYIDDQVKITQDGEELELVGNYVAKTSKGYLKISYNPLTKEYWYVFTDTYDKVIYQ